MLSISSITSSPIPPFQSGGSGGVSAVLATLSFAAQKTGKAGTDVATQAPPPEQVAQAVKQLNDAFAQKGRNLYAAIDRDKASGITVVKVFDKNTKEEISQFPSKAIIAIADAMIQSNDGKVQLMHVSV